MTDRTCVTRLQTKVCFAHICLVLAICGSLAFAESQPAVEEVHAAKIETISGNVIGFNLEKTDGFYFGRRVDVSFYADGEVIPVGSWCVDNIRYAGDRRLFSITAHPVEIQGEPSPGMDARASPLEEGQFIAWFKKAAAAGCRGARLELGKAFYWGAGVKKDEKKGLSLIREAAEAGLGEAQFEYANVLDRQRRRKELKQGSKPDKGALENIFSWNLKAAKNGIYYAKTAVAHAYVLGIGTERNLSEAERWYRNAAATTLFPDEDPLHDFAFWLQASGHKDKAIAIYRERARQGAQKSQEKLRKMGLGW